MANLGSRVSSSTVLMATLMLGIVVMIGLMSSTCSAQTSIADEFLTAHNNARAAVGVGPMVWDDKVAAYAQAYADSQTSGGDCKTLVHSQGGPYGENLAYGKAYTPSNFVDMWVLENQYYDYDTNTCSAGENECGHYTQVVWVNSVYLGCAMVTCSDNYVYSICSYSPRGNIVGEKPY